MFNRTYQIRARRRKLQGEQLDITFPRRGRPSRFRRLERAGQMRLQLEAGRKTATCAIKQSEQTESNACQVETIDEALQMCFPVRPLTEDELAAEFNRLFPVE